MAQYDGAIRIVTKITTKDAEESLASLEWKIKKSAKTMDSLRAKMDALKGQKIPTKEWKTLQDELSASEKELSDLIAKQNEWENMGTSSGGAWDSLNEEIANASDKVDSIKERMQDLVDTGKDFKLGEDTEQYKAWERQINYEEEAIVKAGEHYMALKDGADEVEKMSAAYKKYLDAVEAARDPKTGNVSMKDSAKLMLGYVGDKMKERMGGLGESLKNAFIHPIQTMRNAASSSLKEVGDSAEKSLGKVDRSTKKSSGLLSTLGTRFKGLALSLLVFNQISKAFNAMMSGIHEGIGNLARYSTPVNAALSSMKSALTQLKNSLATAFAPILTTVAPILTSFINMISRAATYVGMLIAALTGQKMFTKAAAVQENYAESLGDTASAAKDANKQLSSLDKLNNLSSNSGGGGGSGLSPEDMFETVPIDNKLLEYLDAMLKYLEKLKTIFSQGFWDGLGDWEYRWESIKNSVGSIKSSLIDIWTDSSVLSAADKWAQSVTYVLGSLVGSVASIGLTIATNIIGGISTYLEQNGERIKKHLISMFDIQSEINNMFAELFQSFAYVFEAFASEQGQQLTANIIGIFTDAFMGVRELASKIFRDIANIVIQPFVDNKEAFRTALEGFLSVLSDVTGTIKQGIDETFDKLNEVYDEHFKPFFDSIANGLSDTVGKFMEFWNENVQPILNDWAAGFDDLWRAHIQPMLDKFIGMLGDVADFLKSLWENVLKPVIDWMIENILPALLPIIDGIVKAVGFAFGIISDVIGGVFDIISGILRFLTNVFAGNWDSAWSGMANTVLNIWDGIVGTIVSAVQAIVGWISDLFSIFNQFSGRAAGAVSGAAGGAMSGVLPRNMSRMSTSSIYPELAGWTPAPIPKLATGTVVPPNREFMAVLGDNKRETEIVSPLSTMKQASKEAVLEVLSELGLSGGNRSNQGDLVINIDGREVFRVTQDYAKDYFRRTGLSPYPI